jgi:hypothetical protein
MVGRSAVTQTLHSAVVAGLDPATQSGRPPAAATLDARIILRLDPRAEHARSVNPASASVL